MQLNQNKIEPVNLTNDAGSQLHVLNRNRQSKASGEGDQDQDELKRFQKMANIYERHNYIKNQIELTKQEVQDDLKEVRRKYQSVPRQRDGGSGPSKSSLLP